MAVFMRTLMSTGEQIQAVRSLLPLNNQARDGKENDPK
jgi:hypothetical protein